MLRALLLSLLLLPIGPALAEEETEPAAPTAPAIREVVEAGNYLFQRAFEDRDARALADLYTEDARVIPPGTAPIVGREAIAAFWGQLMETTQRVRLETDDVEADGGLAAEQGVAHLVANDGSESSIQYVVVWKRVGRRWHLHRDIWNAAPSARTEAAAEPESPPMEEESTPAPEGSAPAAEGSAPAPEPDVDLAPAPEPDVDLAPEPDVNLAP